MQFLLCVTTGAFNFFGPTSPASVTMLDLTNNSVAGSGHIHVWRSDIMMVIVAGDVTAVGKVTSMSMVWWL